MLTEENEPVAIPKILCDKKSQQKPIKFQIRNSYVHQPGLQRERGHVQLSLQTAWGFSAALSLRPLCLCSAAFWDTTSALGHFSDLRIASSIRNAATEGVSRPPIAVFEIVKRCQSFRCNRQSAYESKFFQQKIERKSPFQKKSGLFACALYNFIICFRPLPPLQNGSSRNLLLARPLGMQNA